MRPHTSAPTRVRAGYTGEVLRVARLTPHLVRVVLGGAGLVGFVDLPWADHYVKLVLPGPDGPVLRSYTVRSWDPVAGELALDLVLHGDDGVAGPWAATVQPGAVVELRGQGGDFAVDPACDVLLLAGDESALPAIAVALAAVPHGVRAFAFVEVAGPDDELELDVPAHAALTWVARGETWGGALVRAVRAAALPEGRVQAFLHGEAGAVRELRRHVRADRGVTRADLSASGYWRLGLVDEEWRASKAEWKDAVARDEQQLAG